MIFQLKKEEFSLTRVLFSMLFFMASTKFVIPLYPVPITGQMIAVYFLGLVLSPKESFAAVLGWLTFGICGLPVFTAPFGGPTTGYLIGMLLGTPAVGILLKKGFSLVTSCIGAFVIVQLFGCAWLAKFVPLADVIPLGLVPFIIPEALKMTVVCGILLYRRKANLK
ncbi:MAG: biotin transporter BioY [Holosporales bacterium]|jgi:biotin transport system substrate-specific component|nr:biotin transporter BioY [Holosporales bacterium]